ncbi:MAG: hypothetical protein QY311_01565 [Candidatus Paceibacterota bacterium]|nr:MAG: hypothetical protein QY311_01565 [Candidatus Paceibacterota bacterium]
MKQKTFEEKSLELKEEFLCGMRERGASREEAMSVLHVTGHTTDTAAERKVFGEPHGLRAAHLRTVRLVPEATARFIAVGGVG